MKKQRLFLPIYSILLILILFLSTILTVYWDKFYDLVLLRPTDLNIPKNWYRFLTYPLYISEIWTWFLTSISLFVFGGIIEKRLSTKYIIALILFSSFLGGLIYVIANQSDMNPLPMGTAHMISWGYWSSAMVVGFKFRKELNLLEKIILGLSFIGVFFISRDNLGFFIATLSVIVSISVITLLIKNKNWVQHDAKGNA